MIVFLAHFIVLLCACKLFCNLTKLLFFASLKSLLYKRADVKGNLDIHISYVGPRESFLRDSFYNTCVTKKMRNKSIAVTAFESNGMFAHLYACIIFQNIFLSLRCCFMKQILYLPLLCTYRKDFLSVSHKGNTWDIHRSKGHLVNEDDSS